MFIFILIHSQLIGPTQPIVAMIGHDVILPCHLDPAEDATAMTVEWARPDLEPRFVHVLRDGLELDEKKYHLYMGRTSLLNNQLKHGDVSLKLATVKLSDEGKYKCFIPTLSKETFIDLVVGAASSPVLTINKDTSAVVLDCESKGWHPKPELFWLDAEGKLLSAGAPETVRGPDGLYTVSNSVAVEKSHSNSYTCRVQQHKIQQTRETQIHLEGEQYSKHMTLSQLIGPLQPIVAMIGHDVILPCQLDPAEDATVMTVEWARPDLEPRFVHVLHDGLELDEKKYHLYMGRTSLLNNQLMYGDVSLKLATVKLSDEGKYKCFIPTLSKEMLIDLVVGAASSPVLTINKDTSAVVLDCESKGWHPKPELFWLDGEGNLLPAGAPETVRGPDGLYTVTQQLRRRRSNRRRERKTEAHGREGGEERCQT
uniref:Ig-like domain-containing protein n=1 Tax=Myripristis murdjan TaxID=586833 RepID=A0A667ZEG8_9TELE